MEILHRTLAEDCQDQKPLLLAALSGATIFLSGETSDQDLSAEGVEIASNTLHAKAMYTCVNVLWS